MQPPISPPPPSDEPSAPAATPDGAQPVRGWLALGAGVAAVVGSFLPWATVSAPIMGTITASGVDGPDGWIVVGLGSVLILYGVLTLRGRTTPPVLPVLAALTGLGVFGLGVWKVIHLKVRTADLREELAGSPEEDVFGIQQALSEAMFVRVGFGLWLLTLAGLIATVTLGHLLLGRYLSRRRQTGAA